MRFATPLLPGRLVRRYQRFFADVTLADGRTVTAHCANSGAMLGLAAPGSAVLVSRADRPERTLRFTWELVRAGRTWVGVNTARPNALVAEAILAGLIPELAGYPVVRREVACGRHSRIDLRLECPGRAPCWVEVKCVTLADGVRALFPDAVTERGRKHLAELARCRRRGARAVMLFLVNRGDCRTMAPADGIDPEYGRALRRAARAGVELLCYRSRVTARGITVATRLPVDLSVASSDAK